jgi:nickel superoxide dismutase
MKKIGTLFLKLIVFISFLYPHCQVPCGIYDDALRIVQMKEDVTTIRNGMGKINGLSTQSKSAQDMNQIIRWVNTKEDHASHIQTIVSDYFLTQRIKFKDVGQEDREKYVQQTTILHQLLVAAMKCRQTVDESNCDKVLSLIDEFSKLYFDEHGLKHLKELEG